MKPLLIGMNNPVSSARGHELYPAPTGCAGHRLWTMLDEAHVRENDGKRLLPSYYLKAFERRNLVCSKRYDKARARLSAGLIMEELYGTGRTVVLLGREVATAFKPLCPPPYVVPVDDRQAGGCTWYLIPHPSGRCRWYNDLAVRAEVGTLLLRLYEESRR